MTALIRHMHDFAREVNLTTEEYLAACDFMVRIGHMSDEKRNEVDAAERHLRAGKPGRLPHQHAAAGRRAASTAEAPTSHLGHSRPVLARKRPDAALRRLDHPGRPSRAAKWRWCKGAVYGGGRSADQGRHPQRLGDARRTGFTSSRTRSQPEYNLRGQFRTDEEGRYAFRGLRPIEYPIPFDGPAGDLLQMMDRHPYRPAHIPLPRARARLKELITQMFDRDDQYPENDSVFAVKD